MPIRGESVGTAYIRVIADGSSIPDDIRDSVDDATKSFHDPGSRAAKAFTKGWNDELEKHNDLGLQDSFNKALINDEATGQFFKGQGWKNVEKNFKAKFGSLGQAAADEMKEKFLRQGSLQGIEDDIEHVAERVNRIFDRAIAENKRFTAEVLKNQSQFERDFLRIMNETDNLSRKVRRDSAAEVENQRRIYERMGSQVRGFSRDVDNTISTVARLTDRLKRNERQSRSNATTFGRLGKTIDHIGDGVGRAFGKGSRSELLNFTGSFIGNSVKLLSLPLKILDNIGQFAKGFSAAREAGQGFFSAVSKGFTAMAADAEGGATALSGAFGSILIALPIMIIALASIVLVLGVVSALISGVVAALIALAATITFAALGALSALAALLPPLALGIGAVVLAIATMDDKTKKALSEALKPFLDSLKELGGVARSGFIDGLGSAFDRLSGSLDGLKPLVHDISEAIGDIARRFINLGDKPGPQRFFDVLETAAPRIVHGLGRVLLNVSRFLSNLFADATPLAEDLVDWLIKITREFRKWVAQNPDDVRDFFEKAGDAAKAFGDLLGAVFRLFGTLIGQGLETGNSIFDSLTKNINDFNDSIKAKHSRTVFDEAVGGMKRFQDNKVTTNPLESFFENGENVADDLGEIAKSLGRIADALDNPTTRAINDFFLKLIANIDIVTALISPLLGLFMQLPGIVTGLRGAFDWLKGVGEDVDEFKSKFELKPGFAHGLISWIPGVKDKIGNFFSSLGGFGGGPGGGRVLAIHPPSLEWIPNVIGKIRGILPAVAPNLSAIGGVWDRVADGISSRSARVAGSVALHILSIPGRLGGLALKFQIMSAQWAVNMLSGIQSVPGQIVDLFRGLGQLISDAIGSVHIDFGEPPGWVNKLGGPVFDRFTASGGVFDGAQRRIIGEAGAEAVVPLTGPLSNVDPSVRELSRIARGLGASSGATIQNVPGKTINLEQNITTPATDPVAAASEFYNHLAAVVA